MPKLRTYTVFICHDWEMAFSRRIGQAIIGVKPWGNVQLPTVVQWGMGPYLYF